MDLVFARTARRFSMTVDSVRRAYCDLLLLLRADDDQLFEEAATAEPEARRLVASRTLQAFPTGRFGADTDVAMGAEAGPPSRAVVMQMMRLAGVAARRIASFVQSFLTWLAEALGDVTIELIAARSPSLNALRR